MEIGIEEGRLCYQFDNIELDLVVRETETVFIPQSEFILKHHHQTSIFEKNQHTMRT